MVTGEVNDEADRDVSFAIQRWDEKPCSEGDSLPRLSSDVTRAFSGDLRGLEGRGSSEVGHGMEHPFELSYEIR